MVAVHSRIPIYTVNTKNLEAHDFYDYIVARGFRLCAIVQL